MHVNVKLRDPVTDSGFQFDAYLDKIQLQTVSTRILTFAMKKIVWCCVTLFVMIRSLHELKIYPSKESTDWLDVIRLQRFSFPVSHRRVRYRDFASILPCMKHKTLVTESLVRAASKVRSEIKPESVPTQPCLQRL